MNLQEAGEAHAFVADLAAPELDAPDRHHLQRVLRLRPGAPVTVADGRGGWRLCRFGPILEVAGPIEQEPEPRVAVGVGFAVVKGDRNELVVQKLTELGVDVIAPFVAARSVVRWDHDRARRQHERFVRVAREAAMQCRRARLPVVEPVGGFAALSARPGAVVATLGGRPLADNDRFVLVGPEGGWSDEERAADLAEIGLSPYVLRSETAAITAGALLAARRGPFM